MYTDTEEVGNVGIVNYGYYDHGWHEQTLYLYKGIVKNLNGHIIGDGEALGSIHVYLNKDIDPYCAGGNASITYGTNTLYSVTENYIQGASYSDTANFSDYPDLIGKYLVFSDTEYILITADTTFSFYANAGYHSAGTGFGSASKHTVTISSDKTETISSSPSNTYGPETEYIQDGSSVGIVNTFPSPVNVESLCRIANGKFTGTGSDVVIPVFTSFGILLYWTETESTVNIVNLNIAPQEITADGVTTRISTTAGKVYHWIQILSL